MKRGLLFRCASVMALALFASAAPSSSAGSPETIADGKALVRAMHDRYAGSWYKTLTFVQTTVNINPDGSSKSETWYEAMACPGKLRIDVLPTVREPDGLAMSSRNVRLSPGARKQALALRRGLEAACRAIGGGGRDGATVAEAGRAAMREMGVEPEYFAVVSADTLAPAERLAGELLLAVAARVGGVRLVDNEIVSLP